MTDAWWFYDDHRDELIAGHFGHRGRIWLAGLDKALQAPEDVYIVAPINAPHGKPPTNITIRIPEFSPEIIQEFSDNIHQEIESHVNDPKRYPRVGTTRFECMVCDRKLPIEQFDRLVNNVPVCTACEDPL